MSHRSRRAFVPLALVALLLGQLAGPVAGDHGGRPVGSFLRCDRPVVPPRCTSVGDNIVHRVHFDATVTPEVAVALRAAMDAYDLTKLVLVEEPELTERTDVVAYSEDYGENGAAGWVNCPSTAPQGLNPEGHRWCRQQELYFNLNPRYGAFFADQASRTHVACHELGHTVGLRHWGNPPETAGPAAATCMTANTPNGATGLHQIDIDHINAYPFRTSPTRLMERFRIASPLIAPSVQATEIESAATLEELVALSDAVVRGRVTAVGPGRVFGGASGRPFHYASATIEVAEVLAGHLPTRHAGTLTLEVPLFDGPGSLAAMMAMIPGPESVFFLRSKAESARQAGFSPADQDREADFYRLVVLRGLVESHSGRVAVATDEPGPLVRYAGRFFTALLRAVRAAA